MEIRDTRNGDWHWVYNAVLADPHLTEADKVVYSSISTFGGHEVIHPTLEQIGLRCNVSERQVRYSLRKLEEIEYLSIEKSTGRGNANVYYLLKAPKGCKLCPFYKGGKLEPERGQITTLKGEPIAPHIDIVDKIYITEEESSEKSYKRRPKDQNSELILREREIKMGRKFPNKMKQQAAISRTLQAGYTKEQIVEEYDWLNRQKWCEGKVDFVLVADQIHKEHD